MADWLRYTEGYSKDNTLRIFKLTAEAARNIVTFALTYATVGAKLVIVQLDGSLTSSQTVLLKTLEEISTPDIKFILISESVPMSTIMSRCEVFHFSLLNTEDVEKVLIEKKAIDKKTAARLAPFGGGQVQRALDMLGYEEYADRVLAALNALVTKDKSALEKLAVKWTDRDTDLLTKWCYEAMTGEWLIFDPAVSAVKGKGLPLKILLALYPNIRPRLVVRYSLMNLLVGD